MSRHIKRRDFLDGAMLALAAGAAMSPRELLSLGAPHGSPPIIDSSYYPPTLTGMRGSHDGSFEVAHAMAWRGEKPSKYTSLDEEYDLIVVGAGISGLAAAYLYRKQHGPESRILILDNHDDFGGHAKRNEFHIDGRMLLGAGGSQNLETLNFSDDVNAFIDEIGVDIKKLGAACENDFVLHTLHSEHGVFLGKEHFGKSRSVLGNWWGVWLGLGDWRQMVQSLQLPDEQQQRLIALIAGEKDLTEELSLLETKRYIEATSYMEFLTSRAGLTPETATLFEPFIKLFWGLGAECPSVSEALLLGMPGARSLGLVGKLFTRVFGYVSSKVSFPMFPDGNASIPRLLVRHLIPNVAPGNTMDDIVTARFDYSQLDRSDAPVRLRLNSTAVNVVNSKDGVEVSYVQDGNALTVSARHCILACYNGIIPHLCPEMPEAQKEHLRYGVKIPLVMVNVLLRRSAAIQAMGPAQYTCPGSYFVSVMKSAPVSLGDYNGKTDENDPMVLWMGHTPSPRIADGQSARDAYRLGRYKLYSTPFATFESEIKKQLTEMFGEQGFDAERDIAAITVNRWSHGYTYDYLDRYDPQWEEGQAPHELGRAPIGRISIANSDSEAQAYVHSAIDAAYRAVAELG
ncbi:NAD(P)-binding protein [Litorivivens sp.]|uniref:NAD(P)-binding protein n=1 Tax=Litorivivens sp. TaxID=2020868 RepID=UPI00356AEFE4